MGIIGKRVAYYPGCSLEGASRAYDVSTRIVAKELGLELDYLEDYNCCGAMESKNVTFMGTMLLNARNMSLARGLMSFLKKVMLIPWRIYLIHTIFWNGFTMRRVLKRCVKGRLNPLKVLRWLTITAVFIQGLIFMQERMLTREVAERKDRGKGKPPMMMNIPFI